MRTIEKKRINNMSVLQATFNPGGENVVRIHLIPPQIKPFGKITSALVIVNGADIVPIRKSHTILLANFIEEINQYEGQEISDKKMEEIVEKTVLRTKRIYYRTPKEKILDDLKNLIEDFCRLAYGQPLVSNYDVISIGEYAKYMHGPHRMDMMISAMTDSKGCWHCNNKCLHCYAAGQKLSEQTELSTQEWKKIIDKMRDAFVSQITFTGGEPTLRNDLPELVKYARFFITRVNTNGILLSKELCQKLKKAELDSIQITLYSSEEIIHNTLVGAKTWKMTYQGLRNAVDSGLSVSINTPLCSINKDYISTLKFIYDLGVRYVSCSSIITTGNALHKNAETTQLSESELISILEKACKFCNESGMELSFTSPGWVNPEILKDFGLKQPTCGACMSNMAITPNGKVVPCQSWLEGLELGDALRDDWKQIWQNSICKRIRQQSSMMEGVCPLRKE